MADEIQAPGAQVYNIAGAEPQLGELPHDQVHDAILSGQYSFPKGKPIHVFNPDGELGELPPEQAKDAFAAGFRYALPEEIREEKYGTTGQQAKTFAEGIAEGIAGPLAPMAEKALGVKEEDILGRREENPLVHGTGQAAGLVGGTLLGSGEASALSKIPTLGKAMAGAGKAAAEIAGLGKVAEEASLGYKIGSSAVTQAAEMAVLQSNDEVSKMILNDPNASAESAIANIGLAFALGGAGGAFMTGAVSPLWEATAGPKVEAALAAFKNRINGTGTVLPEAAEAARKDLNILIPDILKAPLAGDEAALKSWSKLSYAQHPEIHAATEQLKKDVSRSVMDSIGIPLEEAQVFSKKEIGDALEETFKKEFKAKYAGFEEAYNKQTLESAKIAVSDDARLDLYGKLLEKGMTEVGTDAPAYKLYNEWGNRILAKDTVGGIDQIRSEIGNDIEKAVRAADYNTANSLRSIRTSLGDFQEKQITRQAAELEKLGIGDARKLSADLLNERADLSRKYKEFAGMSNELLDNIGGGHFKGANTLLKKIEEAGSENLLRKFSAKNNAEIVPFLQKYFPEVLQHVKKNELLDLIKPAINTAKGESPINVERLSKIITDKMSGKKELVEMAIPEAALKRIESAKTILDSIPQQRDSGTPGGMMKLLADIPRSAMAAVSMISGRNPILGALFGEMSQRLGRDVPDAIRLAHLKFLASDTPIKSGGFKAMVDFFDATYKGENLLSKATKNVFKRGTQVLTESAMPNEADRTKLDKIVTKMQDNPGDVLSSQNGQVGHYLPNHQQALTQTSVNAMQYLQYLKPQPHIIGPLDKPVPPQPVEIARYNRALNIAQQPAIVLQHIKDGTLQASDIVDLYTMYPALYKSMSQKLTNEMTSQHADEELLPYKTRVGIGLFLGHPIDKSMEPMSIMAAQPVPKMPQQPQGGQKQRNRPSALGKTNKTYQTPLQASESDRSSRD